MMVLTKKRMTLKVVISTIEIYETRDSAIIRMTCYNHSRQLYYVITCISFCQIRKIFTAQLLKKYQRI